MIAQIVYKGVPATLDDNGVWSSSNPSLTDYLNRLYGPEVIEPSPSAGTSQYANQARTAAQELKASIKWGTLPAAANQDRVY